MGKKSFLSRKIIEICLYKTGVKIVFIYLYFIASHQ